ncbi:glycosyltransferase family 4 protein [Tamlana crocina]|uniref:Glycosyltransferase family 4 protein n=1 Tax=Tamlana crocina TaxID=393006 RepID=A0ABX1D9I2_9FLAO|nr:glycosyltransferase family 4 protein [Tamlana crocina]NJX15032.1 glycosyltransferase family 4 protein [Tamlana crocina]
MKILFMSHETSRTGAPKVLLLFLKWIEANRKDVIIDVLTLRGGNLSEEFKHSSNQFYDFSALTQYKKPSIFERILMKFRLKKKINLKEKWIDKLSCNRYDVIYANTIATLPLASNISKRNKNTRLISHLHELNAIIKLSLPNFADYIDDVQQFIVPSQLVKTNLTKRWSIKEELIYVVYGCTETVSAKNAISEIKDNGIFTVGASGTVHWRKGQDVFLQLARYVKSNYPDVKINFVWVGSMPSQEKIIIEEDLKKLHLIDDVRFVGEVENPTDYYNNFDVFVMTSREDPFPLVCIEVGMLGKPIICFEGATGTEEIMKKGGGFIVPYLSVEDMAEKVVGYYNRKELIELHGEFNKKEFSAFSPEKICPQLYQIMVNKSMLND